MQTEILSTAWTTDYSRLNKYRNSCTATILAHSLPFGYLKNYRLTEKKCTGNKMYLIPSLTETLLLI
jgi:hypothetical protein